MAFWFDRKVAIYRYVTSFVGGKDWMIAHSNISKLKIVQTGETAPRGRVTFDVMGKEDK